VPAALLNVQAHHTVLDLCAAPGSKTLQVLEGLYSSWRRAPGSGKPGGEGAGAAWRGPAGVVVANDLSAKRAYGLAVRGLGLGGRG